MNVAEIFDYTIVGTGLTGLSLGHRLAQSNPQLKIQLLEKSKGCGGRMATRRIGESNFDHGAQFIKRSSASNQYIDSWLNERVARKFPSDSIDAICAHSGITQLAKHLAQALDVIYNTKVTALRYDGQVWRLQSENKILFKSKNIVLTAPLPQTLEMLSISNIDFNPDLNLISYASALVILIESEGDSADEIAYEENFSFEIFSITNQQSKGNSKNLGWTVTMSSEWSRIFFEVADELILRKACEVIQQQKPKIRIRQAYLKKWKYGDPTRTWPTLFESPQASLFLAGDAFGGPSLVGALKSAESLSKHLLCV